MHEGIILISNKCHEIDGLENLKNTGRIYKNYKWIFPFQISEKGKAQKFYDSLKKEIALFKTQWSVSLDIYNQDYLFVVVHGIRDQGEIDQWKAQIKEQQSPITNKENFVTLASQDMDGDGDMDIVSCNE